jgi:signal transduction histidine kinase
MFSTGLHKHLRGIRFRLTLVYSTLFGLFLLVFAYITTTQYFQSGRRDFDSGLINYAIDLSEHMIFDPDSVKFDFKVPSSEARKAFPFVLSQTHYAIRTIEGKVLSHSKNHPFDEIPYNPDLSLKHDYTHRLLSFKLGNDHYRAVNLKITNSHQQALIVQVATLFNSVVERENHHLLMTFSLVPILILFSSFASYLIAGNAITPIKTLTETANRIAAQNLSLRVPEIKTGDEVEELSRTLNSLLSRLEESFKAQENFVANASHQLNTPLAIIKGELDVLESKQRSPEEISKFHQSLREELQRLIELVKNMLLVSRVKSGLATFVFHPLRLDDLLLSTISRMNLRAKDKRIFVRFNIDEHMTSKDLEVMGEKQLLDAVFENLLDNAIKYSPEESIIHLDIKKLENHTVVCLQDEGPGMDENDFTKMLSTRFTRGSEIPGIGIGLSIANKIVLFHNAKILYKKLSPQGSLFTVEFTTPVKTQS